MKVKNLFNRYISENLSISDILELFYLEFGKIEYDILEKEINDLFRLINEYDNLDLKSFLFKSYIEKK